MGGGKYGRKCTPGRGSESDLSPLPCAVAGATELGGGQSMPAIYLWLNSSVERDSLMQESLHDPVEVTTPECRPLAGVALVPTLGVGV